MEEIGPVTNPHPLTSDSLSATIHLAAVSLQVTAMPVGEALGNSLIYEEHKGNPARARAIAEQAMQDAAHQGDASAIADSLVTCGVVQLLQGETSAALRRFQQVGAGPAVSPSCLFRVAGYSFLATQWQFNRVPDGAGQSLLETSPRWDKYAYLQHDVARWPGLVAQCMDPSVHLEMILVHGLLANLQPARDVTQMSRYGFNVPGTSPTGLLAATLSSVDSFRQFVTRFDGDAGLLAYADLAAADLCKRSGDVSAAASNLESAQRRYEQLGDPAGVATCRMMHGDWLAAPFSSPLVWNLAIQESNSQGSDLTWTLEAQEYGQSGLDRDAAAAAYADASRLFAQAEASRGVAAVELRNGYLAMLADDYKQAGEHAGRAAGEFEMCGDRMGKCLARAHALLYRIGEGATGEDTETARAIGAWGAGGGSFSYCVGLGLLFSRAGRHWLLRRGDYERALACYRLAGALQDALGAESNHAQAVVDQGVVYRATGARLDAVTELERAADMTARDLDRRPSLVPVLRRRLIMLTADLNNLYIQLVDPDGIERCAARLKTQLDLLPTADLPGLIASLTGSAPQGRPPPQGSEDLAMISAALTPFVKSVIDVAGVLVPLYRARRATETGDATKAQQWYAEALAAARAISAGQGQLYEATVLSDEGRDDEAAGAYRRYLAAGGESAGLAGELIMRIRPKGGPIAEATAGKQEERTHELAALFFARLHKFDEAKEHLTALANLAGSEWWENEDRPWEWLTIAGEVEEGLGSLPEALEFYDRAIESLEARRTLLSRDELKVALAGGRDAKELYFAAARAVLSLSQQNEATQTAAQARALASRAFGYVERGKSRALLDLLAGTAAIAGDPSGESAVIRTWRELTQRLSAWRGQLALERGAEHPDAHRITYLHGQIDQDNAELAKLNARLATLAPAFHGATNPEAPVLSMDDVANALPEDTALLEYAFLATDLLMWAISHAGPVQVSRRTVDASALQRLITSFRATCQDTVQDDNSGAQLADLLLRPLGRVIDNHAGLIFVPHGAAHALPFHAMPWNGQPLISTHAVSFLPSASTLQYLHLGAAVPSTRRILAIGNPARMAYQPPTGGPPQSLEPLQSAAAEAAYVASLFPESLTLLGEDATEVRVRSELPSYRLVHFATHGVVEPDAPLYSSIMLADGRDLTLFELAGLQFDADLVVLSACETALGTTTGGDDVVGLTRGLLAAGSRAAVVSLWPVVGLSTCLLMGEFYRRLRAGDRPGLALQAAQGYVRSLTSEEAIGRQVERLKESLNAMIVDSATRGEGSAAVAQASSFSHPVYWAPFILVG